VTRRANAYVLTLLLMSGAALLTPSLALAGTGGASLSGGTTNTSRAASSQSAIGSGNGTVSASGNGMTIQTRASTILRNRLTVVGRVPASLAGQAIEVERLGSETHWQWAPTTHGTIRGDGSFTAVWPTNHIGRFSLRIVVLGPQPPHAASASPVVTVTVYRPALATIYGPGFWGSRTACGETLTRRTIGVANRTLPCGTRVAILYGGRTMVVPVIDRGPYANGADWDLTEATATALGMTGTDTIDAVSLHSR
jgi:peptidoglycan lytic transglycosylase